MIDIKRFIAYIERNYGTKAMYSELHRGYEAEIQTGKGPMSIFFIEQGARIAKPNGTAKYYYKVSNAKLIKYIDQIIAANK